MDEITRTLIPEGGFGGGNALSLGAGAIGGLVLGSLWGNGGPWGNRNGNNDSAYNSGMLTGIQTQLSDMSIGNLSNAIGSADRDFLAQTSSQNQFLGNLINNTGDSITAAISANTLAETQNSNATTDDAFLTPVMTKTCLIKQHKEITQTNGLSNNFTEKVPLIKSKTKA